MQFSKIQRPNVFLHPGSSHSSPNYCSILEKLLLFRVLVTVKSLHRAQETHCRIRGTKHRGHNWEMVVLLFVEADTQVSLLSSVGGSTITGSCELSLLVEMRA